MKKLLVNFASFILLLFIAGALLVVFISQTNPGRKMFSSIVGSTVGSIYGANIKIRGWDGAYGIETLSINSKSSFITLKHIKGMHIDKFHVDIDEISLVSKGDNSSSGGDSIAGIYGGIKFVREYISKIFVKSCLINISEDTNYIFSDVSYSSLGGKDAVYIHHKTGILGTDIDWDKNTCKVNIENFLDINGEILCSDVNENESTIKLSLEYQGQFLRGNGKFSNLWESMNFTDLSAENDMYNINYNGNVSIRHRELSGILECKTKYNPNTYGRLSVAISGQYIIGQKAQGEVTIIDRSKAIATGKINYHGDKCYIELSSKSSDILGVKVDSLTAYWDINDSKLSMKLLGNKWNAGLECFQIQDSFQIDSFYFKHENCDIHSIKPIIFDQLGVINGELVLACADVKCFTDLFTLNGDDFSGNFQGNIIVEDRKLTANTQTLDGIRFKDVVAYTISLSEKLSGTELAVDKIQMKGLEFTDVKAQFTNGKFAVQSSNRPLLQGTYTLQGLSDISAHITSLDLQEDNWTLNSQNIDIKYKRDNLHVSTSNTKLFGGIWKADVTWGNNDLSGELSANGILLNEIQISNIPLQPYVFHNLSCDLSMNFNLQNGNIRGGMKLSWTDAKTKEKVLDMSSKAEGDYITSDMFYKRHGDHLKISSKMPFYLDKNLNVIYFPNKPINVNIDTDIRLDRIIAFSDSIDALKGRIRGKLSISGSTVYPKMNGDIDILDASFQAYGANIQQINTSIHGNNNKFIFNNLTAEDIRKNKLHGSGDISLMVGESNKPKIAYNLSITSDNCWLVYMDYLKVRATGKLKAYGTLGGICFASGDLDVTDGEYDNSMIDGSGEYKEIEIFKKYSDNEYTKVEPFQIEEPALQTSSLDLDISLNCNKIRVLANSLNSEYTGKLKLTNYMGDISMEGKLNRIEGYIDLLGTRFILDQGEISFAKEYPMYPHVNMVASSIIKDLQAFIKISCKPGENTSVQVYSKPSYSPEYILSKILFNKPVQELKLAEAAKLRQAISNLKTETNAFSVLDKIQNLFFLNSFSFSQVDDSSSQERTISAGRYIHNKIYVGVEKTTDKDYTGTVKIQVSPQVTVECNTVGEVGANWVHRY